MTNSPARNNGSIATNIILITTTTGILITYILYLKQKNESQIKEIKDKLNKERLAERKGRTNAEMKVRSLEKELLKTKNVSDNGGNENRMVMKCIGEVRSPFTKRMGTPRQGNICPRYLLNFLTNQ